VVYRKGGGEERTTTDLVDGGRKLTWPLFS